MTNKPKLIKIKLENESDEEVKLKQFEDDKGLESLDVEDIKLQESS